MADVGASAYIVDDQTVAKTNGTSTRSVAGTRTEAGMGAAVSGAGRIADVLAMGANASNTSVRGLAEALSYAAPSAPSLGLSLEQTVAYIGKFADAGIDASRAGTALNAGDGRQGRRLV